MKTNFEISKLLKECGCDIPSSYAYVNCDLNDEDYTNKDNFDYMEYAYVRNRNSVKHRINIYNIHDINIAFILKKLKYFIDIKPRFDSYDGLVWKARIVLLKGEFDRYLHLKVNSNHTNHV